MPQSIFFFLGPKAISVAELGETGILVGIRIAGNEQVACESVKDVDSFCEAFLENYNLEELTDLEVSYLVIDAGALQEVRSRFFFHFRRCPRFSSLFLDQALPSVVLAKTEMGLSSSIDFSYKGKGYRLLTQDGLVKLESTELSSQEESLAIRDEDFSALVQPVAIQAKGHQRELRKSRETIAVLRAGLSELE